MKGSTARPRISQCMIVKNEEDTIERALSWGKGIMSEQIVVDRGKILYFGSKSPFRRRISSCLCLRGEYAGSGSA